MIKILFLISVIPISFSVMANEKAPCKYGNKPVCGQPPMSECQTGLACVQMMPLQKNYSNRCEMEKAKAYLVSEGACLDQMIEPLKSNKS